MQYFCNVPDQGLMTFMHPTSLCRFRKRVGSEGIGRMEDAVFSTLKQAGVINDAMALIDSTVLSGISNKFFDILVMTLEFGSSFRLRKLPVHRGPVGIALLGPGIYFVS